MLVLSRKPGEKILIGDQVKVTIVRIGPNTVRIGVDAPKDMNIVREELTTSETVLIGGEPVNRVVSCDFPTPMERAEYREAMEQLRKPRGRLRGAR